MAFLKGKNKNVKVNCSSRFLSFPFYFLFLIFYMLSFENNTFLFGLIILIPLTLLFVAVLRWKRNVRKALGDFYLINKLTANYSPALYRAKFIAVLVTIALGIFALANLRKPAKTDGEKRAGIDVMIALDVSKSMLSEDVKPSRLDKAKQCVSLLLDKLGNNRLGIVVFAGQAFLQMPLTSDVAATRLYLSNATPDAVSLQGTDISSALQLCAASLDTKEKKYKAVVLISDGEDHDPKTKNTLQHLFDDGVIVYTIGIGTAEGSPIVEAGNVYKTDINGQTVISKLNAEELKLISEKTGGSYFHLENSETTADELASQLNNREKKIINDTGGSHQYTSFYPLFTALMILILIAEVFIPEIKRKAHEQT